MDNSSKNTVMGSSRITFDHTRLTRLPGFLVNEINYPVQLASHLRTGHTEWQEHGWDLFLKDRKKPSSNLREFLAFTCPRDFV